jgi:hypothetical protein
MIYFFQKVGIMHILQCLEWFFEKMFFFRKTSIVNGVFCQKKMNPYIEEGREWVVNDSHGEGYSVLDTENVVSYSTSKEDLCKGHIS